MPARIEIKFKEQIKDSRAENLAKILCSEFNAKITSVSIISAYNIDAELEENEIEFLAKEVFSDRVVEEYNYKESFLKQAWKIEIGFLPGVTDNVGKTAAQAIKDAINKDVAVYSSKVYAIIGEIDIEICQKLGKKLANELIEKIIITPPGMESFVPYIPRVELKKNIGVEKIKINEKDAVLEQLSKKRLLALNINEMRAIKRYIGKKETIEKRKLVGLGKEITDVELEAIAQTWSEHCKHKIFNAKISYSENGDKYGIDSLFKTFIKGAANATRRPYVVSAFKDNGGIMEFNSFYNIAVKVETHNAPSALDPYGGALTGILGVNRDIIGTGLGAFPIANINVLCFGHLDEKEIPKGVLHPSRVYSGVLKGIQDGGNKSGIPTVNGSISFESAYTARPLVYCGTIGIMPNEISGRKTMDKKIEPGYLAVMVGGRVGKDGVHGATFSSQQLESNTATSVVQIGDPITQKKMLDFIIEARDLLLYEAITDNGAGGLSSSIGEMAQESKGCEIWLEKVPLKYPGLQPWEILVSESQERMTLAVKKENIEKLEALGKKHSVELCVVGKFTNSRMFHVLYNEKTVGYLDLEFLHHPPRMKLVANWKKRTVIEPKITEFDLAKILKMLLSAPNIASKEDSIRQYDHEVQGTSVVKPLMENNAPCDGAVIKPLFNSWEGIVISHGICPRYIQDSYDMAAMAFDEAVRNALAVGAKFEYLAALDNFSWPNPIKEENNPEGEYILAQLVRACMAVYNCSLAYNVPLISGKDSMKNDYYGKQGKYSILPTLLISVIGKIDDVRNAITSTFKNSGDRVYIIGLTKEELGGSEYYKLFKGIGNTNPKIDLKKTVPIYRAFSKACELNLIESAHDISDGGFGVALAECSFPSLLGVDVDILKMPGETKNEVALLFSESGGRFIVSIAEKNCETFEKIMHGVDCAQIGRVRGDKRFIIKKGEEILINELTNDLKDIWKGGVSIMNK